MSKILRFKLIAALLLGFGFLQAQNNSISIQYGYQDIDAGDTIGQLLFAASKMQVYADDSFFVFTVYSAPYPATRTGNMQITELIFDITLGKLFYCITSDSVKLKIQKEDEVKTVTEMFGGLSESGVTFRVEETVYEEIAGKICRQVYFNSPNKEYEEVFFIHETKFLNINTENLPIYVKNETISGLILGMNTKFGPNTYKLRALIIDQKNKIDYSGYLNSFKTVTKDEMDKVLKSKMPK